MVGRNIALRKKGSIMSIYDYPVKTITGEEVSLAKYEGQMLLIVNTASSCGFTPQYRGLQHMHQRFSQSGFSVLGFPCNQFMHQESGSEKDILAFCERTYQVTFPLFSKIDVNGDQAHPLYMYLKKQAPGFLGTTSIKWNFTKFLVDRHGYVIKRYAPFMRPQSLYGDISRFLKMD